MVLGALAAVAAGLALAGSRVGVGLSRDSFVYLSAARSLRDGHGLTVSPYLAYEAVSWPAEGGEPSPVPLRHFPPLYPVAVAAMTWFGLDVRDAARWLNLALFSVNVTIVGWMLLDRRRSVLVMAMALLWMVLSPDLIVLHAMAWSEPLSLALGFGGLLLLARWLEGRACGVVFYLAATLTGLSAVARYAGVVYAGVGALGLLVMTHGSRSRRWRHALAFAAIAALPMLLTVHHNGTRVENAFNRRWSFHPPGAERVREALATFGSWFAPEGLDLWLRIVMGGGIAAAVVVTYRMARNGGAPWPARSEGGPSARPLVRLLAAFIPGYLVFVLVSMTLLDPGIPADLRLLSPIHVALIPLLAMGVERGLFQARASARLRRVVLAGVIVVIVGKSLAATRLVAQAGARGLDYTRIARRSPLLVLVRGLPTGARIYSNEPSLTCFLAGRPAWPLAELRDHPGGYVVLFSGWGIAARRDEVEALRPRLRRVASAPDGAVYRIDSPPSARAG
jgi:hypothetical protein